MGTNFYAITIPTKQELDELKQMIDNRQYNSLLDAANKLLGESDTWEKRGRVHLGKRSGGWKFLWNPNVRFRYDYQTDTQTPEYTYPLTIQGISDYLHQPNIKIVSEYYDELSDENDEDDVPTADQFLEMALNWCKEDGWDGFTYSQEYPEENRWPNREGYEFAHRLGCESKSGSDFYSDGLRFATCIEFS
ncbi:MAG: hypothetical protein IKU29_00210 [Parabacteroides sp.]|nr:hypothetical protein [Parabacteroides sp.]